MAAIYYIYTRRASFFYQKRYVFLPGVPIEHSEEVVVGAGHDSRIVAVPTAFKLVENAIVFVQRTKL